MGFGDYETALKARDVHTRMIETVLERLRPEPRQAEVYDFNTISMTCDVLLPGDDTPLKVKMGRNQIPLHRKMDNPDGSAQGDIVRFAGRNGNYYLLSVYGTPSGSSGGGTGSSDPLQRASVRAATTANITLSGTQTVDGVALVVGDRVLVRNQTTAANNGIYVVATGAWARSSDANTEASVARGSWVKITEGNAWRFHEMTQLQVVTTLGTDAQAWRVLTFADEAGSLQAPTPTGAGHLFHNQTNKVMQAWDTAQWQQLDNKTLCTSTTRPGFFGLADGHIIYESDTGRMYILSGGAWALIGGGSGSTVLGFATTNTPQSGIGTTEVALTGMSVAATVPAGHRVRVTFFNTLAQTVAPGRQDIWIRQDGTSIQTASYDATTGGFREFNVVGISSPAAGSHTWTVGCATTAGSTQTTAQAGSPAWLLVEDLDAGGVGVGGGAGTSTPLDNYFAAATGGVSFDGSDVPGCTLNVVSTGPADKFLVIGTADLTLQIATNAAAVIDLVVDGGAAGGQILWIVPSGTVLGTRSTNTQNWVVSGLAAGTHVFKLKTNSIGSPFNQIIANGFHTRIQVTRLAGLQGVQGPAGSVGPAGAPAAGAIIGSTGFRNALRNGDFSVAQRGNGPHVNGYGLDGWRANLSAVGVGTMTRNILSLTDSATIGGPKYEGQYVISGTATATDYCVLQNQMEDVRTLAGKQVTLSFWAYGNVGNKIGIEVQQIFGTGGSPSANAFLSIAAIPVTTGWAKYTTTFTVPSVAGKTLGTNSDDSVVINFWFSAGSTFAARASTIGIQNWTAHLTDVQLEEGPNATNFERIPFQQQLAWCQRYFYRWTSITTNTAFAIGTAWLGNSFYAPFRLPVPMRASPTFASSALSTFSVYGGTTNATPASIVMNERNTDSVEINFTTSANLSPVGGSAWLRSIAIGATLDFSAELV